MSTLKNGKAPLSDKEKYRALSKEANGADPLNIPSFLVEHFASEDLVGKWVSRKKIQERGGYHPSGWVPYEMSEEQKKRLPTGAAGISSSPYFERADMVLAVKPKDILALDRKKTAERTRIQRQSHFEEVDARGNKILDPEVK